MKLSDAAVTELIRTCLKAGRDTFFALEPPRLPEITALAEALDGRTITLLPGTVYPVGNADACVLNAPEDLCRSPRGRALLADVRLLGEPAFADYAARERIRYFLLPFYEAALTTEYGYKFSYRQIAELRAALPFPVQIIGVSLDDRLEDGVFEALGTRDYAMLGEKPQRKLYGVKTEDLTEAYGLAARQCRKTPFLREILLCATRTEAEHLHVFFGKWGIKAALFHGGLSKEANAAALQRYETGGTNVLIATKSALPSYPFLNSDRLFYCGLPYSLAHADRCAALHKNGELTCLWCEESIETLRAQTAAFAQALQITDPSFLQKRSEQLNGLLQYLEAHS